MCIYSAFELYSSTIMSTLWHHVVGIPRHDLSRLSACTVQAAVGWNNVMISECVHKYSLKQLQSTNGHFRSKYRTFFDIVIPTIVLKTPPNVTGLPTIVRVHGVTPEICAPVAEWKSAVVFCCCKTTLDKWTSVNMIEGMRSLGVPTLALLSIVGGVPCTKVAPMVHRCITSLCIRIA